MIRIMLLVLLVGTGILFTSADVVDLILTYAVILVAVCAWDRRDPKKERRL